RRTAPRAWSSRPRVRWLVRLHRRGRQRLIELGGTLQRLTVHVCLLVLRLLIRGGCLTCRRVRLRRRRLDLLSLLGCGLTGGDVLIPLGLQRLALGHQLGVRIGLVLPLGVLLAEGAPLLSD